MQASIVRNNSPLGIGLIGLGTVGRGVAQLLRDEADRYQRLTGRRLEIRRVLVRDTAKAIASGAVPAACITADPTAFFATPGMDVVVEVAGGVSPIGDLVQRALELGKPVVTANKALLAARGSELFGLARKNGAHIAFEASCGGGIPCILALTQGLHANRLDGIFGILNGTTNYILSQMAGHGQSYAEALAGAQALGFAEADPTMDVSGADAKQKLCILASLAFGVKVDPAQVPCTGIERLEKVDFEFGREMGYTIKLLAAAERWPGSPWICAQVRPCFVPASAMLAKVDGGMNALSIVGHATGHTLYYGAGAGSLPTASAVVSDLLNSASGVAHAAFHGLAFAPDLCGPAPVVNTADTESAFYVRLKANDRPGVLAEVAQIFGRHGISIAGFLQHPVPQGEKHVPMVFTTHQVAQGKLENAAAELAQCAAMDAPPVILRIVALPK